MLVVLNFDGTIVQSDPFVQLGEQHGTAADITTVLDQIWDGTVDHEEGLRSAAGFLEGLPVSDAKDAYDQLQIDPSARSLLSSLHRADHHVAIISDAPERAIDACLDPRESAVDTVIANSLSTENDAFTGEIAGQPLEQGKDEALNELAVSLGQPMEETIAVGHNRGDLPMMQTAGTGIGIDPTPTVEGQCDEVCPTVERLELLFEQRDLI